MRDQSAGSTVRETAVVSAKATDRFRTGVHRQVPSRWQDLAARAGRRAVPEDDDFTSSRFADGNRPAPTNSLSGKPRAAATKRASSSTLNMAENNRTQLGEAHRR